MADVTETKRPKLTLGSEAPPRQPLKIRLTRQHSFIEEETGRHRVWKGGEIVADAHEIALLSKRGAVFDELA